MHDEPTFDRVEVEENQTDAAVLALLLHPDNQRPFSDAEVARETGAAPHLALDALDRLEAAGLIHRLSGFVWAARPALRASQIAA